MTRLHAWLTCSASLGRLIRAPNYLSTSGSLSQKAVSKQHCRHLSNLKHRLSQEVLLTNSLLFHKAYINGRWVDSSQDAATFEVTDPATGQHLGSVPDLSVEDARAAVEAADEAQTSWARTTLKERSAYLRKLFELIEEHSEDLAKIITLESGKPLAESRGEVLYGNSFLQWFSEEAKRVRGDAVLHGSKRDVRQLFIKQPVGVAALITPWNFPLAMLTRKAGAALAAGCCVVIKPAEDTPLTALAFAKITEKAKLPPGVVNVVTCSREQTPAVGELLCTSSKVKKVSFTGSTAVGKHIYALCSSTVKRISLELGGNAPFIVFNSADVDKAIAGAMSSKFRNTGQACVASNRIFVQSGIYDEFCSKLAKKISQMKLGHGTDPTSSVGPLINERSADKVQHHLEDAVSRGASVRAGTGRRQDLGACFFAPTLVTDVPKDALVNREETFGPLAAVIKFETEEEVVSMSNSVQMGLAAYLYSSDAAQMFRVAEDLQFGIVGVNEGLVISEMAPFGGVKESGVGREGSIYGIEEYQEIKYIYLAL